MEAKEPPQGWGKDPLAKFIDDAQDNSFGTFVTHPRAYALLVELDGAFRTAHEHLSYSQDWLPAVFLLRSHSCFLGATRLAVSTQLAETYMVLRGCLEAALYAHLLYRDPKKHGPIWIGRHKDAESHRRMRTTFSYGSLIRCLERYDVGLAGRVKGLYERTIDFGGHPNEQGLLQSMKLEPTGSDFQVTLNYLSGDSPAYRVCIQALAEGALLSLEIYRLVFWERFSLIGLSDTLEALSRRISRFGSR